MEHVSVLRIYNFLNKGIQSQERCILAKRIRAPHGGRLERGAQEWAA